MFFFDGYSTELPEKLAELGRDNLLRGHFPTFCWKPVCWVITFVPSYPVLFLSPATVLYDYEFLWATP